MSGNCKAVAPPPSILSHPVRPFLCVTDGLFESLHWQVACSIPWDIRLSFGVKQTELSL